MANWDLEEVFGVSLPTGFSVGKDLQILILGSLLRCTFSGRDCVDFKHFPLG